MCWPAGVIRGEKACSERETLRALGARRAPRGGGALLVVAFRRGSVGAPAGARAGVGVVFPGGRCGLVGGLDGLRCGRLAGALGLAGGEVVLALPWLWFLALAFQTWRAEGRFFLGFALLQLVRSTLWFLGAAQALEVEPYIEGARAIGARRGRIFLRHLGPWLLPMAARLVAEGAAAVVPLDLLLSLVGVGSGLQAELARAALEGQRRGDLWLTCVLAAALGALLLVLPERLGRPWSRPVRS